MTQKEKVPSRGFCIGPPPNSQWPATQERLNRYFGFDALKLTSGISYFTYNVTDLRLNQAAAWQSQLQNGPAGNINYGAYQGSSFINSPDALNYQKDCRQSWITDNRGYEWAGVFAHSWPNGSNFHEYSGRGAWVAAGRFNNDNFDSWQKVLTPSGTGVARSQHVRLAIMRQLKIT